MQATLTNITTNFTKYYPQIDVITSKMYLQFELDTSDLQDGEYILRVFDDDNMVINEELVKIGEYTQNKVEYKVDKKFIQYGK